MVRLSKSELKQSSYALLCVSVLFWCVSPRAASVESFPGGKRYVDVFFHEPERNYSRFDAMDIYVPDQASASNRLPCILLIHGGGYGGGDKAEARHKEECTFLAKRGFITASINYTLGWTGSREPVWDWDCNTAVRFLRKSAATYHVNAERMAAYGWSAGGWLSQKVGWHDERSSLSEKIKVQVAGLPTDIRFRALMDDPDPQYPEYSSRLQAMMSDWGAGMHLDLISPDDPPTMVLSTKTKDTLIDWRLKLADNAHDTTDKGFGSDAGLEDAVKRLAIAGVPVEQVFVGTNSHGPVFSTPAPDPQNPGQTTTEGERVARFFELYLKTSPVASAPEIQPLGGTYSSATPVTIKSVTSTAVIYYTLDGTLPTKLSTKYVGPISVSGNVTVRAIAYADRHARSGMASAVFRAGTTLRPRITIPANHRLPNARVGEPFSYGFQASTGSGYGILWAATGGQLPEGLTLDHATGLISGTPYINGVYPLAISAMPRQSNSTNLNLANEYEVSAVRALLVVEQSNIRPNAPDKPVLFSLLSKRIHLRWRDRSGNESKFLVERKVSGGGFAVIDSLPMNSVEYIDQNVSAGTTYSYRVLGRNEIGLSDPSEECVVATPATDTLPKGWTSVPVGQDTSQVMAGHNSTGLNMVSGGWGLSRGTNAKDAFHFVCTPVKGDFTVQVAIAGMTHVDDWTRSGIMVRENLEPGSLFMSIGKNPYEVLHTTNWRITGTSGTQAEEMNSSCQREDVWLKLVRSGTKITAYASDDGLAWDSISQKSIPLAQDVFVGTFNFNRGVKLPQTVVFKGLKVNGTDVVSVPSRTVVHAAQKKVYAVVYDLRGRRVSTTPDPCPAAMRSLAHGVFYRVIRSDRRGRALRTEMAAYVR